ncbi:N-acetylglucosaminylphosphatidylinositol deacetylase [Plasmodiophora brassicae]
MWAEGSVLAGVALFIALLAARIRRRRTPLLTDTAGGAVALVIAHPDDESMFFVPTISRIVQHRPVHLLCLSNGNAEGLGREREKELDKAARFLGFTAPVTIVNDDNLCDGMDQIWSESDVAKHVLSFLSGKNVTDLITFDSFGVSGHANHIAVSHGVRRLSSPSMRVWTLASLPLWRKYIGPINIVIEFFRVASDSSACFITNDPLLSFSAMQLHASQLVWYRYLFVIFSSYTFSNRVDLVEPDRYR